jgi:LysM repeat protein
VSVGQVAYAREPGTLSPPGGLIGGSNSFSAGGSAGISANASATDRARAVSSGSACGRTHTVKGGETPYAISRQYRVKLEALFAANPGLDPKRIRIGQVLNIPAY